ncbi:putative FBD-associated F-box protein At3g50710 [Gastrolobium bilobum]|uniref:putative FBD-associated F-box protein At3g50710 n=1 Tax=Gastrolobium bilobum TaxID=150636 RepID=UPI002AB2829F|nr:putative FBD-associated F-box protein At3g50710 [Gastrolobium bilobum]
MEEKASSSPNEASRQWNSNKKLTSHPTHIPNYLIAFLHIHINYSHVPTLDFDLDYNNESKEKYYRFVQSLYEVILSRDSNQPIQTFRIKCGTSHCEQSNVNVWVNAALQRNVEHLDILLSCNLNINLPSAIFRHRTLVVLKLNGIALKATSSVDLPSLKILHLDLVMFLERRYFAELLSGCPLLEDLVAKNFMFDNRYPTSLTDREFKGYPSWSEQIFINGYDPINFVFDEHEMDRGIGDDPNPYAKDNISVFHNLVHIELTYFHYTMNWLDVIELLNHCPKLQILFIDQDFRFVDDYKELDWQYPLSGVPECISLHLKTCHLNDYKGSKGEVRFARYVMRNRSRRNHPEVRKLHKFIGYDVDDVIADQQMDTENGDDPNP